MAFCSQLAYWLVYVCYIYISIYSIQCWWGLSSFPIISSSFISRETASAPPSPNYKMKPTRPESVGFIIIYRNRISVQKSDQCESLPKAYYSYITTYIKWDQSPVHAVKRIYGRFANVVCFSMFSHRDDVQWNLGVTSQPTADYILNDIFFLSPLSQLNVINLI